MLIEAIRTISSLFFLFFFDEKISRTQKHVTSENQLTKQKQANLTLNNKDNNFSRAHKLLGVTRFCVHESFRQKKTTKKQP